LDSSSSFGLLHLLTLPLPTHLAFLFPSSGTSFHLLSLRRGLFIKVLVWYETTPIINFINAEEVALFKKKRYLK